MASLVVIAQRFRPFVLPAEVVNALCTEVFAEHREPGFAEADPVEGGRNDDLNVGAVGGENAGDVGDHGDFPRGGFCPALPFGLGALPFAGGVVGEGVGTDLVFEAIMQIAVHRIQESVVLRAIRVPLHVRLVHAEQAGSRNTPAKLQASKTRAGRQSGSSKRIRRTPMGGCGMGAVGDSNLTN